MSDEIDRELIGIFEFREGAADRLAELGRRCVDLWAYAISTVARANPGKYLDWLTGRTPSTLDLVILGDVDDPRASTVLRAALGHPEWLHRHHAEESLARRGERP